MKKRQIGGRPSRRGVLLLGVSFLSGIGLLMAAQGMVDDFLEHPAFQVREVEVQWPAGVKARSDRFRLNPPTSIFRVDLKSLAISFQRRFPSAEVEGIRRHLPNRLVAVMRPRKIVGQISVSGLYAPVSDDGILIFPASATPRPELPVLVLEGVKGPLRVGRSIDTASFWKASELLSTLHRDGGIAGHKVINVRVEGDNLFLALDSSAEIRFSGNNLSVEWQQLSSLIARSPGLLKEPRYVDLRYGDPVIGELRPKNEKRTSRRRS